MAEIMSESSDKATNYYYFFFALSFSLLTAERERETVQQSITFEALLELIPNVFLCLPTSGGKGKGGTNNTTTNNARCACSSKQRMTFPHNLAIVCELCSGRKKNCPNYSLSGICVRGHESPHGQTRLSIRSARNHVRESLCIAESGVRERERERGRQGKREGETVKTLLSPCKQSLLLG